MFSTHFSGLLWGLLAIALLHALWRADWQRLGKAEDAKILFAACVLLWLVWRIRAELPIYEALDFHLLLVTTITLMFGQYFALLVVLVAESIYLLDSQGWVAEAWQIFPFDVLTQGVIPIWVTVLVYHVAARYLPRHFFIYIYLGAFLAGGVAMLASRLSMHGLLLYAEVYTAFQMQDMFALIPIMLFPEAFVNGALMTLLVVLKPQWVSSFDDKDYLHNR